MRLSIASLLVVGCWCALASHAAAQAQEKALPLLTVSGEASAKVAPDLASVRAGTLSTGKTVREASEANAKAMNAVLAVIKQAGIEPNDIQTSHFSVQPVYARQEGRSDQQHITGYQVSNQVTVTLHDLTRIGDLLDSLVAAGANDVWNIEFRIANPSAALDQAREQAFADARRKADLYARAAGVQVGRVIAITEEGAAPPAPTVMRAAGALASATPIAAGTETLHTAVTVSFEIIH